jgi:MFS family permease
VTALAETKAQNPSPAIPVDSRRNLLAFTSDIATFITGTYFIPVTTVLVGLASQLTDDKALIGAVGMTWSVTWFLPQVLAARMVRGKRRQKPYLMIPSLIGRNLFLLFALWLLVTDAQAPILTVWVLIACLAVFNILDAIAGVAWFDMLSRALSPRMRSRSVSVGQFIGGIAGIGAGLIVGRVLAPQGLPFPQNYAFIFGCTWFFMMLSLVLIAFMREIPMTEAEHQQTADTHFLASLNDAWANDRLFRRVLVVRILTGMEMMAASFFLVFAQEELGVPDSATGIFNIALIFGGIAGIAMFGWLADRFTSLSVIRGAGLMQFAAPAIALVFGLAHAIVPDLAAAALVAFSIVFVLQGAVEHSLVLGVVGYLLDSAPERHRAMYVGAINTVSGVVALTPLIGGIWIDATQARGFSQLGYLTVFAFVSVCVGIGLLLSLRLPRHKPA